MAAPLVPDAPTRTRLLAILAEHVAAGGAGAFLAPPIRPSTATFPERWRPTRTGVVLLLRRLAWHAGIARDIVVEGEPIGAPPTERKPATRVELVELRAGSLVFDLGLSVATMSPARSRTRSASRMRRSTEAMPADRTAASR